METDRTLKLRRLLLAVSGSILAAGIAAAQAPRSAYTYVRESTGQVLVTSGSNGEVQARRNMPISVGDEMKTEDAARAEIALADGNILHVGGGTRIRFVSLSSQQGSDDDVSAIELADGSVVLSAVGSDERSIPRIDTDDATVYANSGARVRVNNDSRRGTAVVARAGSVEVKARTGSYTVRAGNYLLVQGDQEPEIARGSFSRDRFDIWVADRMETTYDAPQSASSRYVEEEYAGDVQALDGYGDWDYNSSYSSYVWRPNVPIGWTPYSYGNWYNTPVGLTWWSYDPWGWYPYHYGNWFFDAGWNSWCWSPGYIYSPAWVYWAYTPNYFGWCPTGWYGGYSPWWNTYYRNIGWGRGTIGFAINGRFSTRTVDMRGWNFTGVSNLGGRGRLDVVPGTRVVDRLGNDVAISSRPIILSDRGAGGTRQALRDHVREAPRLIERTSSPRDSERLAPVLARNRTLPEETIAALRDRTVVADRGRLTGPGVSEISPRGTTTTSTGIERGRSPVDLDVRRPAGGSPERTITGRTVERPSGTFDRGRGTDPSERTITGRTIERPSSRTETQDTWRGRAPSDVQPRSSDSLRAPSSRPTADAWRRPSGRSGDRSLSAPPRSDAYDRGTAPQDWRSRPDAPARRVIEGSVPGRRSPDMSDRPSSRGREDMGGRAVPAPRDAAPSRGRDSSSSPRFDAPRSIQRSSPPPQAAPAPRSAPSGPPPSSHSAPQSSGAPHRGRP